MQASKFSRGAYTAQWLVQPFSSFPFLPISSMLKFSWPQVLTLVQPTGYARKNRPPPYVQQPASSLRIRDVYRWRRLWVEAELQVHTSLEMKWGLSSWGCGASFFFFFFFLMFSHIRPLPSYNYLNVFSSGVEPSVGWTLRRLPFTCYNTTVKTSDMVWRWMSIEWSLILFIGPRRTRIALR